jgi:predicted RNA-binding Zn-ribbon protein involved in translation (DUF1610 family)
MNVEPKKPSRPTMWCKTCGYVLDGLSENRCPDCGRTIQNRASLMKRPFAHACKIVAHAALTACVALTGACGTGESHSGPSIQNKRARFPRSYIKPDWDPPPRSRVFDPLVWHGEPDPKTTTTLETYHIEAGVGLKWIADFHALEKFTLFSSNVFDSDMTHLSSLNRLADLSLNRLCITDAGLLHLADVPSLESLEIFAMNQCRLGWPPGISVSRLGDPLDGCDLHECRGISGSGLAVLAELPNLISLTLSGPIATDANMAHLAQLKGIRTLRILGAPLTDAGLKHLRNLQTLELLEIRCRGVSEAAIRRLRRALSLEHPTQNSSSEKL